MSDRAARVIQAILQAYQDGYFPMADPRTGSIDWYSPDPRATISLEPGALHFASSLLQRVRSGRFRITTNRAFEAVIRSCAMARPTASASWIDDRIVHAYTSLHLACHAHSVEAWLREPDALELGARFRARRSRVPKASPRTAARSRGRSPSPAVVLEPHGAILDGERWVLVGGLYGVHIGSAFFGESMFSHPEFGGTDASKVAFFHLVSHLRARGFTLLDTQFSNEHMEQFGIEEIERDLYLSRLRQAIAREIEWDPWDEDATRGAATLSK